MVGRAIPKTMGSLSVHAFRDTLVPHARPRVSTMTCFPAANAKLKIQLDSVGWIQMPVPCSGFHFPLRFPLVFDQSLNTAPICDEAKPCDQGGQCLPNPSGSGNICTCPIGFYGPQCGIGKWSCRGRTCRK